MRGRGWGLRRGGEGGGEFGCILVYWCGVLAVGVDGFWVYSSMKICYSLELGFVLRV